MIENIALSKIAYLVSEYPAPSHTFIRREIAQLRALGLKIDTYSVRKPVFGLENTYDRDAKAETFYILGQSAAAVIVAQIWAFCTRPLSFVRTFVLAMQHRVPGLRAFIWALFHFAEAMVLARKLSCNSTKHLHVHFANSGASVGMLAAHFLQMDWSLTLHGISETDYPAGLLLRQKVQRAHFVACVSYYGRAQAMRLCDPADWSKFHIVRCGVDIAAISNAKPTSFAKAKKNIICVGRLASEKGHIGLIDAFGALLAKGVEAELILVGDGPELRTVMAECVRQNVKPFVHFLGRLSERDTLAAIADADILVLPSFMEGLPVVLMEAMALGVPVVASRVAGIPELVEHGVSGLLFTPSDWNGLTQAMAQIFFDPAATETMAQVGEQIIAEQFDIIVAAAPLPALLMQTSLKSMERSHSNPAGDAS